MDARQGKVLMDQCTTISGNLASFQNGVDSIYNGCNTYGSTPTAKTPAAIINAIKAIYDNRYQTGYSSGKKDAENYILGHPNLYSLYTQAQYDSHYNAGVAAGRPFTINDWAVWATSAGAQLYVDLTNYSTVTFVGISGQTNDDRFSGPGEGNANNSGVVHRIISEGLNGQNKVYDVSGMTGVQQVVIAVATGRVSISRIEFR